MKKWLVLLLVVGLLFGLIGCANEETQELPLPETGVDTEQSENVLEEAGAESLPESAQEESQDPSQGEQESESSASQEELPENTDQESTQTEDSQENGEGQASETIPDNGQEEDQADMSQTPTQPQTPSEPENPGTQELIQPDDKGMMNVDGNWVQSPEALDSRSVERFQEKLQSIRDTYLAQAGDIYYSIIPDKSYYARDRVTSWLDHDAIMEQLRPLMSGWNEIAIEDLLTFSDFLKTDNHWRQEEIVPIAQRIAQTLGFTVDAASFTQASRDGFVGSYGSFVQGLESESISWMESQWTKGAVCDNYQYPERTAVYDPSLVDTVSAYDLFMGGQTPLVSVEVPDSLSDGHLIIFRDSFGASLAPLLLSGYSKVTLIDLRYMVPELLPEYVDFTDADVLFLFCDRVVNNSNLLR